VKAFLFRLCLEGDEKDPGEREPAKGSKDPLFWAKRGNKEIGRVNVSLSPSI